MLYTSIDAHILFHLRTISLIVGETLHEEQHEAANPYTSAGPDRLMPFDRFRFIIRACATNEMFQLSSLGCLPK